MEEEQRSNKFRLHSPSLNSVRLRRIFDLFDNNKDNVITVEELREALVHLGLAADPSEMESMVKSYIRPGQEGLSYEDFEALHISLGEALLVNESAAEEEEEEDLKEAFKVFDEDGDGFISARELQAVLGKLGLKEGNEMERVEMMISSVDENEDGRVDIAEFKNMMRNVAVPVDSS
ncbi:hypothetical protein M569_09516 [Genlisea aurea]|uniref:EF-hand domain-containing protein n=1 Tax=Genlisea aurea TaxID=192259 RepID=S8CE70_9LAMI|nr:hypothetical protein M569_09516 [Genlisea aurea]